MKVLHISRTMGQGGAEKIVYQLCRDNSAEEQIVVSCGGVYADKLEQDGIKQYKIPDLDNKNPFIMLKCLALIFTIVRTCLVSAESGRIVENRLRSLSCQIIQAIFLERNLR